MRRPAFALPPPAPPSLLRLNRSRLERHLLRARPAAGGHGYCRAAVACRKRIMGHQRACARAPQATSDRPCVSRPSRKYQPTPQNANGTTKKPPRPPAQRAANASAARFPRRRYLHAPTPFPPAHKAQNVSVPLLHSLRASRRPACPAVAFSSLGIPHTPFTFPRSHNPTPRRCPCSRHAQKCAQLLPHAPRPGRGSQLAAQIFPTMRPPPGPRRTLPRRPRICHTTYGGTPVG